MRERNNAHQTHTDSHSVIHLQKMPDTVDHNNVALHSFMPSENGLNKDALLCIYSKVLYMKSKICKY